MKQILYHFLVCDMCKIGKQKFSLKFLIWKGGHVLKYIFFNKKNMEETLAELKEFRLQPLLVLKMGCVGFNIFLL